MAKVKTAAAATKAAGKAKASKARRYQPHPMLGMENRMRMKVETDTGRSWEGWLELVRKKGPKTSKEIHGWLQEEHEVGANTSQWLAYEATTPQHADYQDPEPLVDALYSGDRKALRPIHEAVVDAMLELGEDVIVTACKTMVPVYRTHVFAELRPVDGGVEVQLAMGDVRPTGRLEAAGGRMPGDRLTHRVHVRSAKDVDAQMRGWLGTAYEKGAKKMSRSTEFEVPADFAKALKASKTGTATWRTMTHAMQRDMVLWVTSAKQAETRARRLETAIAKLAAGKKRVY